MGRTGVGAPFMQLWKSDHIHWVINTLCSAAFEGAPTPLCVAPHMCSINSLLPWRELWWRHILVCP